MTLALARSPRGMITALTRLRVVRGLRGQATRRLAPTAGRRDRHSDTGAVIGSRVLAVPASGYAAGILLVITVTNIVWNSYATSVQDNKGNVYTNHGVITSKPLLASGGQEVMFSSILTNALVAGDSIEVFFRAANGVSICVGNFVGVTAEDKSAQSFGITTPDVSAGPLATSTANPVLLVAAIGHEFANAFALGSGFIELIETTGQGQAAIHYRIDSDSANIIGIRDRHSGVMIQSGGPPRPPGARPSRARARQCGTAGRRHSASSRGTRSDSTTGRTSRSASYSPSRATLRSRRRSRGTSRSPRRTASSSVALGSSRRRPGLGLDADERWARPWTGCVHRDRVVLACPKGKDPHTGGFTASHAGGPPFKSECDHSAGAARPRPPGEAPRDRSARAAARHTRA